MRLTAWLKRLAVIFLLFCVCVLVAGPWALYWFALGGIDGSPELPISPASAQERQEIWQKLRGGGEPTVTAITPYEYFLLDSGISTHPNKKAGVLLAWQVASNYNLSHLKYKGMAWWHFSGAALTIWLTRNWTTEQLLSKAAEIRRQHASQHYGHVLSLRLLDAA